MQEEVIVTRDNLCTPSISQNSQAQLLGLRPPAELRKEENRVRHIDSMVAQEDYRPAPGNGKNSMTFAELGYQKPYMFIDQDGLETHKQKLDVRNTLTALEYISASLSLLADPSAYDPKDRDNILRLIIAVSIDTRSMPWAGVRRWSQLIWDNIEKGRCNWSDHLFIQDERVRISYMSGNPSANANSSGQNQKSSNQQNQAFNDVICREFNSPSECRFTQTHEVGPIKYVHACSHCDSLGPRSQHSFQKCRTRAKRAVGGSQNRSHGQRQWQPYHGRQQYNQQNTVYSGQYRNQGYQGNQSKNM